MITTFLNFVSEKYDRLESFLEKSNRNLLWGVVLCLNFGIILFLNVLTPMLADDFGYLYVFAEKVQVANLSDLIRSQITHYNLWGGRSVVHFLAQALLQMPGLLVNVLNSLMYLLFLSLIYLHIKGRDKEKSISLFILINLAVWFCMPMFGDTILWLTGSANYLWGTTIVLLFLLPYRLYNGKAKSVSVQVIQALLFFVAGVLTGWTNENTVVGLVVIILLFFVSYRLQKWRLPIPYMVGLVGVLIGYVIMIAAPGNYIRAGQATELSVFIVLYRLFMHTQALFMNYGVLIALFAVLLVLYGKYGKGKKDNQLELSFIFLLGALASIYVMVFSPSFPLRAWFGVVTYFLIAIGIVYSNLDFEDVLVRRMRGALIFVSCIAFVFSFYVATKDIYRAYVMNNERELLAKEAKAKGEDVCVFRMFTPETTYVHGEEATTNLLLSYYYGIFIEYEKE